MQMHPPFVYCVTNDYCLITKWNALRSPPMPMFSTYMPLARVLFSCTASSSLPPVAVTVLRYTTWPSTSVTSIVTVSLPVVASMPLTLNVPLFGFGISLMSLPLMVVWATPVAGSTVIFTELIVTSPHVPVPFTMHVIESPVARFDVVKLGCVAPGNTAPFLNHWYAGNGPAFVTVVLNVTC